MNPYTKGRFHMYSFKWGPGMEYEGPLPRVITVSIAGAICSVGMASMLFAIAQVIRACLGR